MMSSASSTKPEAAPSTVKQASGNVHGPQKILQIVKKLHEAGIPSCIVGISALMYYGARRVRNGWDICVPTEQFDVTISLLRSNTFAPICMEIPCPPMVELSLFDTYPHFNCIGFEDLFFRVVSARAAQLRCERSNFEWSQTGLPYPKLPIFIQSAIDSRDNVALADAIDGMNLSEEWGVSNLDLSYADDNPWAKWANERMERTNITATVERYPTNPFDRKSIWQKTVAGKQTRGGWKYPKDVYATRFRMHGSVDPRTRNRIHV